MQKRVLTGKQKLSTEEKDAIREKKMKMKNKWEMNNLGDFEVVYPLKKGVTVENDELMHKYDVFIAKSKEIWEESISGGGYVNKKKETEPIAKINPSQN